MGGFYTTRVIEASFDKVAGESAIEQLQAERKFRVLRAQVTADPVLTAEEIEPTDPLLPGQRRRTGWVFYPADEGSGDTA